MFKIRINTHGNPLPEFNELGNWVDLRASERVEMKAGENRIIPLGISMELPEGYEAWLLPRSSTFKKWGITMTNSKGIIDTTYCGDNDIWGFSALAHRDTVVEKGDRIWFWFYWNKVIKNIKKHLYSYRKRQYNIIKNT